MKALILKLKIYACKCPTLCQTSHYSTTNNLKVVATLLLIAIGISNVFADETWDLSKESYSSSSTDLVTWLGTNATLTLAKNGGTNANNYLGGGTGSNNHTRVYNKNIFKITPASGQTISSIEITASGTSYTIAGTWTNGTASTSGSVTTVTPTDGTKEVYCTCSATKRLTKVVVKFGSPCSTNLTIKKTENNGTFTLRNGKATGDELEGDGKNQIANCDAMTVYAVPDAKTGYAATSCTSSTGTCTKDGDNWKLVYSANTTSATVTMTFTAQQYTVTLDKNGGTGGTASVKATYDATCPEIGGSVPTKTGYEFKGYYSGSGGTGTLVVNANLTWVATASGYTSSGKWVKAAATTLYAKWEATKYDVKWYVNGVLHTTGGGSTSVAHDSRVAAIPNDVTTASGCGDVFVGWTTAPVSGQNAAPTPLYKTQAEFPTASKDQIFYAVFADYGD